MLSIIISIMGIIITILLVVGVHELGHFLVAKSVGIKVLRFSIGFGKTLYSWHDKQGTEYILAAIPLGGYVKMLDEGEDNVKAKDIKFAFNRQTYPKKFAVIAAGPLANLIFAFLIYWLLFMIGFVTIAPVIGEVKPHSIAAVSGLRPQQEIMKIDDRNTATWTSVIVNLIARSGDHGNMKFETRDIETQTSETHLIDLASWHLDDLKPDPLGSLGMEPYQPVAPSIIGSIQTDSPAAKAHLLIGDNIIAIAGKSIANWGDLTEELTLHPEKTLLFTILRQDKKLELPVTISYKRNIFFRKKAYLGISPAFGWPTKFLRINKYGPLESLAYAAQDVKTFSMLNFITLKKMLSGKISLKSLGGPITIFQTAGNALNQGFITFMSFLAFLSISIGLLNILPIPGLDGGHLLFQTIESIIRRPLSVKVLTLFYRLGMIFIVLIMIQALVNDIFRLM